MTENNNPAFEFVVQLGKELAEKNFDLPPFPETALRIQDALKDPDISIEKLSAIVLSEPVLAARLLRMANSAMLRRGPSEITDIKTAISRIGLDMVQNAAVSYAAREAFKAPKGSSVMKELEKTRKHSIKVAALAYVLGRKIKHSGKPDEAMLAGLLHAVGKYYILVRADEFPELFADEDTLEALLEQWHTGVGRAIVESWGFPENIADAVDEHELLDRDKFLTADLTDLVLVANLLARQEEERAANPDAADSMVDLPSLSRMKLDAGALHTLIEESEEEIRSMTEAMSG